MSSWHVDFDAHVPLELAADIRVGRITRADVKVLRRWVMDVESNGLSHAQANRDWRDHELIRGKWRGYRAISFSNSGRLIYRVESGRLVVTIVRVTTDHDYK